MKLNWNFQRGRGVHTEFTRSSVEEGMYFFRNQATFTDLISPISKERASLLSDNRQHLQSTGFCI